jgi:protein-disulfide isomerase
MSRKTQRNQRKEPTAAPATAGSARGGVPPWLLMVALFAVVFGAVGLFIYKSGQPTTATGPSDNAPAAALASEHSPTLGEAAAKVHVVEFLDPACETCAAFFPIVKQLMAENPGKIRLSTRHVALHEGSETPIRVLEASRAQDKYWETLAGLFATQPQWAVHHQVDSEQVMRVAASLGLDMDRLQADMQSPAVNERIERDRADGKAMKVTATPEYFVNGQPMPSFGEQQLRDLVAGALDAAY